MTLLFEPLGSLFDVPRVRGISPAFVPAADLMVTGDEVTMVMDVPGLTPDDLEIELLGDTLTVRGERRDPYADAEPRAWRRAERGYGRFERHLQVPEGLDPETISASMEAGVLTVRIPKPQAQRARRIEITTGEPRSAPEDAPTQVLSSEDAPTKVLSSDDASARELTGAAA